MPVYALGLYTDKTLVGELCEDWSSISWWKGERRLAREFCRMAFREVKPREGRTISFVRVQEFLLGICSSASPAVDQPRLMVLASADYPQSALAHLLLKAYSSLSPGLLLHGPPGPSVQSLLEDLWASLRDPPATVLTIDRVKSHLEETKGTMLEAIEKVAGRGVKLDHLVEKSNDLSYSSKLFYKRTKTLSSSCCTVQ
jgi:hypothetical protein